MHSLSLSLASLASSLSHEVVATTRHLWQARYSKIPKHTHTLSLSTRSPSSRLPYPSWPRLAGILGVLLLLHLLQQMLLLMHRQLQVVEVVGMTMLRLLLLLLLLNKLNRYDHSDLSLAFIVSVVSHLTLTYALLPIHFNPSCLSISFHFVSCLPTYLRTIRHTMLPLLSTVTGQYNIVSCHFKLPLRCTCRNWSTSC